MTDIAALVERLREHQCGCGGSCGQQTPAYIAEAADEIERLRNQNHVHALPDGSYTAFANGPAHPTSEHFYVPVRNAALEEAADVADQHATIEGIGQKIAAAIRALKDPPE